MRLPFASSSARMLSWLGSRCCTSTKAMPVSIGSAPRSCLNASSPPAEAPTPTMGKALRGGRAWTSSARRHGLGAFPRTSGRWFGDRVAFASVATDDGSPASRDQSPSGAPFQLSRKDTRVSPSRRPPIRDPHPGGAEELVVPRVAMAGFVDHGSRCVASVPDRGHGLVARRVEAMADALERLHPLGVQQACSTGAACRPGRRPLSPATRRREASARSKPSARSTSAFSNSRLACRTATSRSRSTRRR